MCKLVRVIRYTILLENEFCHFPISRRSPLHSAGATAQPAIHCRTLTNVNAWTWLNDHNSSNFHGRILHEFFVHHENMNIVTRELSGELRQREFCITKFVIIHRFLLTAPFRFFTEKLNSWEYGPVYWIMCTLMARGVNVVLENAEF